MMIFLSPGHTGLVGDYYMTPGKRSREVGPGVGIYEGEFNREVCACLERWLKFNEVKTCNLAPGPMSASPGDRAAFVNRYIERTGDDAIYVSVHANASPAPGWSDANGARVFCAKRCSRTSLKLAAAIQKNWNVPGIKPPKEIKRKNFTEIYKTTCPAVLVECGFMTNRSDSRVLSLVDTFRDVGQGLFNAIVEVLG
jgi:N-acetylmuramoyl-L-alanine amidase